MIALQKLITDLCPNGVPIFKLGELEDSKLLRLGRGDVISKTDLGEHPGSFPVYSSSAVSNGLFGRYGKFMFDDERITWSIDGGGKFFYRAKHEYSVTNVCGWLKVLQPQSLITKYIYYVLIAAWGGRTYNYTAKAHPSVIREDYSIPLPPIEVQQEIVRILDAFTELEALLVAQIEESYRLRVWMQDALFNNANIEIPTKYVSIMSAAQYVRGLTYSKSSESNEGSILVLRANNIDQESNTLNFQDVRRLAEGTKVKIEQKLRNGDILMSTASGSRSHVGKVCYIQEDLDYYFGGFMAVFRANKDFHAPYLFHLLSSRSFQEFLDSSIESTTINNLSASLLERFLIPVVDFKSQLVISSKLDVLSELIHNLQSELNLRRKQYEYYRSKILNFDVLDVA